MNSMAMRITLVSLLVGLLFGAQSAWAQNNDEIIASLQRISGSVSVQQAQGDATVTGRNGLLLRAGDTVITAENSKATIKFRTGSEIRLFPKTNFVVEAKEKEGEGRFFKVNLVMKLGSFWGNFVKRRQVANISTPTATIGIKGTTLRVVDRSGQARVALTEGLIDVSNERETVELQPGKRIRDFGATESITSKIEDIPYKLDLKSDKQALEFSNNRPEEVFLTVQLIDIKSGSPIRRSGPVYLRSNYDKINYPAKADLDERGFARVSLQISPPEAADAKHNGNLYIWAVLDQEEADDTSEGRILFKIPVASGKSKIRVDAQSGSTKKVQ